MRAAEFDPDRGETIAKELRAEARSIGQSPRLWSPVPSNPGTRKKSYRPYVLLYTISGGEVLILRVVHQRSDWVSLV